MPVSLVNKDENQATIYGSLIILNLQKIRKMGYNSSKKIRKIRKIVPSWRMDTLLMLGIKNVLKYGYVFIRGSLLKVEMDKKLVALFSIGWDRERGFYICWWICFCNLKRRMLEVCWIILRMYFNCCGIITTYFLKKGIIDCLLIVYQVLVILMA